MPETRATDDLLVDRLTEVFQRHGYEGASIRLLSRATGLQRASLYHRFPGGKEEMAQVVLERAVHWLSEHALGPLSRPGPPQEKVRAMTAKLAEFYARGHRSCLLDTLSLGEPDSPLRGPVRDAMRAWLDAMAAVAAEAGATAEEAARRAEAALVRVEGGLVVARGNGDSGAFLRALESLPRLLAGPGKT